MRIAPADLRKVVGLQHATEEDLGLILANSLQRAIEEGAYLFLQGDPADHFYVLTEGQVKLVQGNPRGQQVILRTVYPWQLFGALGIARAEARYPVSAQAMQDSAALAIRSDFYRKMAVQRPYLSMELMQVMTTYVQEMQSRYRELATERVEQRIAMAVLRLASQLGTRDGAEGDVELNLSRQELAELSGTTIFTVSRVLSDWERRGVVRTGRERISIVSPHGLVRIAEGTESEEAQGP